MQEYALKFNYFILGTPFKPHKTRVIFTLPEQKWIDLM
jgi:hypothetical protein